MTPQKRVLLGLSGGRDSFVAIHSLREMGFFPVGITFITKTNPILLARINSIADILSIEHHYVDIQEVFSTEVVNHFVDSYLMGQTPNPCVRCNQKIKWPVLFAKANELKCDFVATGHYAQIIQIQGQKAIQKAFDDDKDQSFFLWGLEPEMLDRIIFPLGGLSFDEVKEIAQRIGFGYFGNVNSSVGPCFTETRDYRLFLREECKKREKIIKLGAFFDLQGNWLGHHKGYPYYTIGQRKGLGIKTNRRYFVNSIDTHTGNVFLSDFNDLFKSCFYLSDFKIHNNDLKNSKEVEIRVRYRGKSTSGKFNTENERLKVMLKRPEWGIAPGQAIAIYDRDVLVGGGFIAV